MTRVMGARWRRIQVMRVKNGEDEEWEVRAEQRF